MSLSQKRGWKIAGVVGAGGVVKTRSGKVVESRSRKIAGVDGAGGVVERTMKPRNFNPK